MNEKETKLVLKHFKSSIELINSYNNNSILLKIEDQY